VWGLGGFRREPAHLLLLEEEVEREEEEEGEEG
jgi:hypothetical protein